MPQPPGRAKLPAMLDLPHADVVGSLIRPPELLAAREDLAPAQVGPGLGGHLSLHHCLAGCGRKVRRSAAVYGASTVSAAFGM